MLKKYLNKIPALLGGLFLVALSSQAVAASECGDFKSLDAQKWGSIVLPRWIPITL